MTINVLFFYNDRREVTRGAFPSFEKAEHHAIEVANGYGIDQSADEAPAEVWITEDERIIFAIRVVGGSLTTSTTPRALAGSC